jgi:hypothetical protein
MNKAYRQGKKDKALIDLQVDGGKMWPSISQLFAYGGEPCLTVAT